MGLVRVLGEALVALVLPACIYLWLHPLAWQRMRDSLWLPDGDPYRMGDVWGTLFMIQRSLYGEVGCDTLLYSWPLGQNICAHFPNPLVTNLMAPFVARWGLPYGYNLAALFFLASTGLSVWLAVRALGGRWMGALVGSAMVGMLPMLHLEIFAGRPVTAWWAPALACAALAVAALDSWRRFALLVPALGALALAIFVYPYALAMLAPWVVFATLFALARGPDRGGVLLRAVIAALVSAPLVWWVATQTYGEVIGELSFGDPLLDRESHWGLLARPGLPWLNPLIVLLEIAGAALLVRRADPWRWLPLALNMVVLLGLGLGPTPFGDPGKEPPTENAPFTWMIRNVHIMRGCARPERFVLVAALLVPIVVGLALSARARWIRGIGYLTTLAGLVWLKIFIAHVGPHALLPWPPVDYRKVIDNDAAILELPLRFSGDQQAHMMGQTLHVGPRLNDNYPIANRWVTSIQPSWAVLWVARELQEGRPVPEAAFARIASGDRDHADDLGWVIVHRKMVGKADADLYNPLIAALNGEQVLRSRDLVIYRVP